MKYIISFLSFFCLAFCSMAQDSFESDLEKLKLKLEKSSSLSFAVNIKMYDKKGGQIIHQSRASMRKSGTATISTMAETEIFTGPSNTVIVDHLGKTVSIIAAADLKDSGKQLALNKNDMKAFLSIIEKEEASGNRKTRLTENSTDFRSYEITGIQGYELITIRLNVSSGTPDKITFSFDKSGPQRGAFLDLDYEEFKTSDVLPATESDYFTVNSSKKMILNARFRGYTLTTRS